MSVLSYLHAYSVGRKVVMGLSGLFLVSFLFVHVSGNALLFVNDGGTSFNQFTRFMTTNPVIGVLEWVLFAGFLVHISYGILLTFQNRGARPERYAYRGQGKGTSSWFSRHMDLTGVIFLFFLVVHIIMFWGKYHYGSASGSVSLSEAYEKAHKVKEDVVAPDGKTLLVKKDHYVDFEDLVLIKEAGLQDQLVKTLSMTEVVRFSFSQPLIVAFYMIAMLLLASHLAHGFQSAFRSLGLYHKKYFPLIRSLGFVIAVVIPTLFAAMPVWFFLSQL